MRFKPILFSTEMVRAILEGRKTQTRRIIKPQPDDEGLHDHTRFPMSLQSNQEGWWGETEATGEMREVKCPYGQIGDVLWVREGFVRGIIYEGDCPVYDDADEPIEKTWYRA